MNRIFSLYHKFLKEYGCQGWWPLTTCKGTNPTKTGAMKGYHVGDYSYPRNDRERLEICIGAILTQNTNWQNVEKALLNLKKARLIDAKRLAAIDGKTLGEFIRPAGYYNQKAKKLKILSSFFVTLKGRTPSREELLSLWGIGPETADSILLYAYNIPTFVVDAYTRRMFSQLGHFRKDAPYDEIRSFFERNLPQDHKTYQEFHALIVEHAKRMKK